MLLVAFVEEPGIVSLKLFSRRLLDEAFGIRCDHLFNYSFYSFESVI